jgi:hypothetical protein
MCSLPPFLQASSLWSWTRQPRSSRPSSRTRSGAAQVGIYRAAVTGWVLYSAGVCGVGTVQQVHTPWVAWRGVHHMHGSQHQQGQVAHSAAVDGAAASRRRRRQSRGWHWDPLLHSKAGCDTYEKNPKELTALGLHSPGYLMSVLTQLATCRDGGRGHTCVIMAGKQARLPNECSPAQQLLPCQTRVVSTEGTGHVTSAPG